MRYFYIFILFCSHNFVYSETIRFEKHNTAFLGNHDCSRDQNYFIKRSSTLFNRRSGFFKQNLSIPSKKTENRLYEDFKEGGVEGLVINELLASNSEVMTDQDGEYDDWIELYNNSNNPIDLSGYLLSDDLEELDKWVFPDEIIIDAGGYLIIWADGDIEQEGLHASFKLSSAGESLFLSSPSGLEIIDEVHFDLQTADVSYGRPVNGTGDFHSMSPSFGTENDNITSIVNFEESIFQIYPNPAGHLLYIRCPKSQVVGEMQIYDSNGNLVHEQESQEFTGVNVSNWQNGTYIFKIEDKQFKVVIE